MFKNVRKLLSDFRLARKLIMEEYTNLGSFILISIMMVFVVVSLMGCVVMDMFNFIFKKVK